MSKKISIDEIQIWLEDIIAAPTNKEMLNGIWRLRNKIAGDYNTEKLNKYIAANKELADDLRRHKNRRDELEKWHIYKEKYDREVRKLVIEAMNNFEEDIATGPMPNILLQDFKRNTDKCCEAIQNIKIEDDK